MSENDEHVSPEASLIKIVGEPGLRMALESGEAALHAALDEGFLKELPVVGTAARLIGIVFRLRERLFLKKLAAFLNEAAKVDDAQRELFVRGLEDAHQRQQTGAILLHYLDHMAESEKAALLGRFFSGLLQRRITRSTFDLLAWALDKFFLQDLEGLKTLYEKNYPEPEAGARITNAGLATPSVISAVGGAGAIFYSINPLGIAFVEIGGLV